MRRTEADSLAMRDAIDFDPFNVVIDTRGAGITGSDAHYLLLRDHRIYCELATESALVLLLSAPSTPTVAFRPTRLPRILLECRTCRQGKC